MEETTINANKSKKYAYTALVGAILTVAIGIGSISTGSLYLLPMSEALGVSLGVLSVQFTFNGIGGFLASLTFGSLLKKLGPKTVGIMSAICILLYFVFINRATSATMIYIGAAIWAFGTSWGGFSIGQTEISWWFSKNRGKMISILSLCLGLMGIALPLIVAPAIERFGARPTALVEGLIIAVLLIIVSIFLLKKQPSAYGLEPYEGARKNAATSAAAPVASAVQKMTFNEILKTRPFWFVWIGVVLFSIAMSGFVSNASPIYQSIGVSAVTAGLCVSLYNAGKLVWSPIFGFISDKKSGVFAANICYMFGIIALLFVAFGSGVGFATGAALLVSAFSVNTMIGSIAFTSIYGTENAGQLVGMSSASTAFGAMFGAPIAGFIFDAFGSFANYSFICIAIIVVGMIFLTLGTSKKSLASIRK